MVRVVSVVPFPFENLAIKKEYTLIKRNNPLIGDGERACMAIAKFNENIIVSSNFRDIVPYCTENGIRYLGTLDVLAIALLKGIFDVNRCDNFINKAKEVNKAKFPPHVKSITDYTSTDISYFL